MLRRPKYTPMWTRTRETNLLKSIGINVNMAPVCDVTTTSEDFMYDRSFSNDVNETTEYVKRVVSIMKQNQLGSDLNNLQALTN